ncbi:MAG: aminotransferase class-III [Planctomycetaceae bacterium]|nr:aminotransferase class-III [Planctomycetaceae bacterium]
MNSPTSEYGQYCRPRLVELLQAFSLDVAYERAEGDWLWFRQDGELVKVLDFVGGFGANLLGHYHPDLIAEERRLLDERVPIFAQGSCRAGAGRVARALCERIGDYVVILTNTGAETVEAAIKHAYLERPYPLLWGVQNAFHGKTTGAIQLTANYCGPYEIFGPRVRFLDPSDPSCWLEAEAEAHAVSAAFVEPVQGEGGVRPLPRPFVDWLRGITAEHGIPIVADEIQTGLGRTGNFLACEEFGIIPDYLCLSKALGGGMAKIGALLVKRERFVPEFSVAHTSTFAEDERSCALALKTLELIDRDQIPQRCAAAGRHLLTRLEAVRCEFPELIKEVRGRGLMIGIELQDLSNSPSNSLRMLSQQKFLSYLAAAYLLRVHRIRLAPTLSQAFTLRIAPSAYVGEGEIDQFLVALSQFCAALRARDITHLTSFQVGLPAGPIVVGSPAAVATAPQRELAETDRRVAFIGHLIFPEHAALWDPALTRLPPSALEAYMAKPSRALGPTIFEQFHVHSPTGERVHFTYVGLDLTPTQIMAALAARDADWIKRKVEEAIELARDAGCRLVGLGAYTSIVTGNGLRVKADAIELTTGNALTVGMGVKALSREAAAIGLSVSQACLGIVGATGNIGAACAVLMAPHVGALQLVVRDLNSIRASRLVAEIRAAAPGVDVSVTTELNALRGCGLIMSASNSPEPLIFPHHLGSGPVVICDLSLPADIAPEVRQARADVRVLRGGVVRLPCDRAARIAGLPLNSGHVFACIAETLLLGLENTMDAGTRGLVTPAGVEHMLRLADKHGFELADSLDNLWY